MMAVTEYCLWVLCSLAHSYRQSSLRCLSVRHLMYFDFNYFHLWKHHFTEVSGSKVGTHSVHMWSLCWHVPKSHCPLIWLSLMSFCKSTIPISTPLGKLNTCWNLAATCSISMGKNGFETNATISSMTSNSLKCWLNSVATLSRWAQYLSRWRASVFDGLWHFLQVGKVRQPPIL